MGMRALISIRDGRVEPSTWEAAIAEEDPTPDLPAGARPCARCPLALGGPWDGCTGHLPNDTVAKLGRRWGCHRGPVRCASAVRIAAERAGVTP